MGNSANFPSLRPEEAIEHNQRNKRQRQKHRSRARALGIGWGWVRKSDRFAEFRGEAFGDICDPPQRSLNIHEHQRTEMTRKTGTPYLFHLASRVVRSGLKVRLGPDRREQEPGQAVCKNPGSWVCASCVSSRRRY